MYWEERIIREEEVVVGGGCELEEKCIYCKGSEKGNYFQPKGGGVSLDFGLATEENKGITQHSKRSLWY